MRTCARRPASIRCPPHSVQGHLLWSGAELHRHGTRFGRVVWGSEGRTREVHPTAEFLVVHKLTWLPAIGIVPLYALGKPSLE